MSLLSCRKSVDPGDPGVGDPGVGFDFLTFPAAEKGQATYRTTFGTEMD